jgi:uncharacterized protein
MVDMRKAVSGPVGSGERSVLLDTLRGWALLGILVANMMAFTGFFLIPDPERGKLLLAGFDDAAEFILEWLVIGKFYAMFSLLFGIGFAIQIGRLEQRGEATKRYLRRLFILFLFGLAHLLLLWLGDILALYALMGAVLLLFRRMSDRALLFWAAAMWAFSILWAAGIHFAGFQPDQPIFNAAIRTITATGLDVSRGPLPVFQSADLADHLRAHPGEALIRLGDLVQQMRFTKVLGMFLIGLWVGRRAIHADSAAHRQLLRRVATTGLTLGLPLSAVKAVLMMWPRESPAIEFAGEVFYCLGTPTLALGYAAAFTLVWLGARRRALEIAAPAGQMALTNYLMQTVLQSAIFYGWGLGLIGKFGLVVIAPIGAANFALQILYSRLWLSRFRFGPAEWLWRSASYGTVQPMRRDSPEDIISAH